MSNLQAVMNGKTSETFARLSGHLTAPNIKIALAGFSSVALAAASGVFIAGWFMPLEAQPRQTEAFRSQETQARVLAPVVGKPVKVASLDGQIAIPGGYPNKGYENVVQNTETIVPRQSENGLNPYTVQKPQQVQQPANTAAPETLAQQKPLAVPPPVALPQQAGSGLQELTDNVVSKLQSLKKQEVENTDGNIVEATDDLRQAIKMLVIQATSKGKSSEYIQALIDDALAGRNAVPAALANSDGKLNTRLLLDSVLPKKNAAKVGKHANAYMAALNKEVSGLTIDNAAPVAKTKSVRKKRFIIVRKGDNLSEIAMRVYGDPLAFAKIYKANRKILANANILSIGQRLFIPR